MIDQINIEAVNRIAREAGKAVLEIYGTAFSVEADWARRFPAEQAWILATR